MGEFPRDRPGRNWNFLHEESSRLGRFSGGGRGRILGIFTPKDHLKGPGMGRRQGEKRVQKRAIATNCYSPLGCHYL